MADQCDTIQPLISGYVDGELDPESEARVETHVASCARCRKELESMRQLAEAADALEVGPLPDEVWDKFLDGVYNRLERRAGWTVFILGAAALGGFALYHFIVDPWASAAVKTVVAAPIAGLGVLFVSVVRQRLSVVKSDRYSRDVRR